VAQGNAGKSHIPRSGFLVWVAVLTLLSCTTSVSAQEKNGRWTTRLFGSRVLVPNEAETIPRPADEPVPPGPGVVESVTLEMGDGWGLGLGVEYRLTDHLFGLEIGAMALKLDTKVTWNTDLGAVVNDDPAGAIIPLTLAANFHLLNAGSAADFYVAALVSWTLFDDAGARYAGGDMIKLEDSFGIGFDLGLNYALADGPFLISGIVRYLAPQAVARVTFESSEGEVTRNLQCSPLMLNLGIGYRF
jgi:outer membrane protein W